MTTTVKLLKKSLNASRGAVRSERANSILCGIYSDAIRDEGDDRLADIWASIAEFLPVFAEHRQVCWGFDDTTSALDRRDMIALDHGTSGCFLVEKATGQVWNIKAYGRKKNVVAQDLATLTQIYRENIAAFKTWRGKAGE